MEYQQWKKGCRGDQSLQDKKKNHVKGHNKACIKSHLLQMQEEEKEFLVELLLDPKHFVFSLPFKIELDLLAAEEFTQSNINDLLEKNLTIS